MCNLYSMTKNADAIRRLFGVDASRDQTGNLPSMPGIFPDYPAPIVRNGEGGRELVLARWGMPSSQRALMDATKRRAEKLQAKGKAVDFKEPLRKEPDSGTTNIRNVSSAHWKRWHYRMMCSRSSHEAQRRTRLRRSAPQLELVLSRDTKLPPVECWATYGRHAQASGEAAARRVRVQAYQRSHHRR